MTQYARVDAQGEVERIVDLTTEQYALLQANGKADWLRLWIVDTKPEPTATQVVIDGGIVVTAIEAHQTWALREKTAAELGYEQNESDRQALVQLISALTTDIQAYNANPDVTGTAVERLAKLEARVKDLERQQRRDNLIGRHYLRSIDA